MHRPRPIAAAVVLAASILACTSARAARPEPYRLEDALTLRTFSDLAWSRDGNRLVFVVTEVDTAENTTNQDLWLADLRSGDTFRLTRNPGPDTSPTFSPGGDTLAFVSTRGDDTKPGIYMMSLHGGDPWPFGTYAESVGEVQWSPDGKYLAYVMTDTLPARVKDWRKKKWDQVVEDERLQYPRLWVTEVATGQQRPLTSGSHYLWYVRWSPNSRSIAFITSPTGKPDDANEQDIGVVPVEGGPMRALGVIGDAFAWSPDGKSIALAATSDRKKYVEKSDLWVVPLADGRAVNLTSTYDGDAQMPAWAPRSDALYFHAPTGVTTRLAAVTPAGGGGAHRVALGTDRRGEAGAPVIAANGRTAWVQSQPLTPPEVWVAESIGAEGRPLTSLNAAVTKLALGDTRTFRWTSSDGTRIEGLLLRPPGVAPGARLKTLVLLHGGPYGERFSLAFQSSAQYFAAHGYQVFMPNFRSSAGYGTAFMLRKRSDWGGQDWRDVMTGVDSLVAQGLADSTRLGVFGHSYGGYLSAWAITQTRRFKAACVSAGAMDLASHFGESDIHQYRAFEFGGDPWQTPEKWARSSPATHIANAATPTLILAGEEDRRVPYAQGRQMYTALQTLGVPSEFVHYPREGHTLREYRHRADWHMRVLEWFDRWIR